MQNAVRYGIIGVMEEQTETKTDDKPPRNRARTAIRIIIILAAVVVVIAILVTRFTSSGGGETPNPHIVYAGQSGAAVSLKRERLETAGYDEDGVLKLSVNDGAVDFAKNAGNVFGLSDGAELKAGDSIRAYMAVNNGGEGEFAFWLSVRTTDGKTVDGLTVTVEMDGAMYTANGDGYFGTVDEQLATVGGGGNVSFEVEISVEGETVELATAVDLILYIK